jgi:hypothetical protein
MPVHTGHQTEADCSSDSLGHFSLVDGPQSCVSGMLDLAQLSHELGHHGKVLENVSQSMGFRIEQSIPSSGSKG